MMLKGTPSHDTLTGTPDSDQIIGLNGNDVLSGGAGNDTLNGGPGDDTIAGGNGADKIIGAAGFDTLLLEDNLLAYSVIRDDDETYVGPLSYSSDTDMAVGIELLRFADYDWYLDGRNNAPYVQSATREIREDTKLTLASSDLAALAIDVDDDNISLAAVGDAQNGSVSYDPLSGVVTFSPTTNYHGEAGFSFTIEDSRGVQTKARLQISVQPTQDTFSLAGVDGQNGFIFRGEGATDSAFQVGSAGDVNGDGIDDMIVGAYRAGSHGQLVGGQAYVVFGQAGGLPADLQSTDLTGENGFAIWSATSFDGLGMSAETAGDVNNDGYDDLIVGAPYAETGSSTGPGVAYVLFGHGGQFDAAINVGLLDGANGFAIEGDREGNFTGEVVSSAGDVNGDGYDDVIVGAERAPVDGQSGAGKAYVVFGQGGPFAKRISVAGLDGTNGFTIEAENGADRFGRSVNDLGDINGDGFDDVIVGAPWSASFSTGLAYIVYGRQDWSSRPKLNASAPEEIPGSTLLTPDTSGVGFGWSASSAGDMNGDGLIDIAVGAVSGFNNGEPTGSVYVLFGRENGFGTAVDLSDLDRADGFRIEGTLPEGQVGYSLDYVDVNGDGLSDLIIGAPTSSPDGANYAGSAYIVFGRTTPFESVMELDPDNLGVAEIVGAVPGDNAGVSVSSAGDLNNDGFGDVMIGASGYDRDGVSDTGASYVLYGGSGSNWLI